MVTSGLLKYNDLPENYWAWKSSFLRSTSGLDLTPAEELDLLSKWLGAESSEQAMRIRSVHIHNPTAGLQMVWQRLEETYGSPDVIEHALLKKVEIFPKLTNRDTKRFRDLGDILLELDAAKTDGYLPGLTYLDTARGVRQIIEKLPYNIVETWNRLGTKYKEEHRVTYPPFSFFVRFICDVAKTRNDPSFPLANTGAPQSTKEEKPMKQNYRTPVSVRKTEVSSEPEAKQDSSSRKMIEDPDKQCPLHNKPHPLRKCRSFRSKPLDERKSFLKDRNICFRCCASTRHYAKDCEKTVQCKECSSDKHLSVLHPGPAPWRVEPSKNMKDHGGEQQLSATPEVTSKCTEVCGDAVGSRSCSKICLVKVYPAGRREKAVRVYAVLDEQSNKSLARTEFFDLFEIKGGLAPYTLKTCSGVMETTGRRANNYVVESIDGKTQITLPTLIECDAVPDDRSEIPSPEVALHYAHLKPVANKIPPLDPDAAILLLLGRDILRVHKVREQHNGPHNAPYAQRLDLGWVIIGEVCLGGAHRPAKISVYKTNVLQNGRTSFLEPCTNSMYIKERVEQPTQNQSLQSSLETAVSSGEDTGG